MSLRLSVFGLPLKLLTNLVIGFLASLVAVIASNLVDQPKVGTVLSVAHGNVACYLTLIDEKEIKYEGVAVVFDVGAKEETFLNKNMTLYRYP